MVGWEAQLSASPPAGLGLIVTAWSAYASSRVAAGRNASRCTVRIASSTALDWMPPASLIWSTMRLRRASAVSELVVAFMRGFLP